jgi:hypothetical protein
MAKLYLTYKDLQSRGHPYTPDHTRRLVKAGRYPAPVKMLGCRTNLWLASEIEEYDRHMARQKTVPSK